MNQFNINITCRDYKVQPIAIHDDFAIFVGIRPLYFHFVVMQAEVSSGFNHIRSYQFHLHKFDVASEFLHLQNQAKGNNKKEWIRNKERDVLQMSLDPEMNCWMKLDFLGFEVKIEPETGQWFLDALEKEMERVESSIAYLSEKKNQVELLRKLKLPLAGDYDFTSTVWRCVQFEKYLNATYRNKANGISKLYPKLLKGNTELSESDLNQVAEGLDSYDPLCTCDFSTENAAIFDKVQRKYFPQEVYIRGKQKLSSERILESAQIMCANISPLDQLSLTYLLDDSPMALVTLSYFGGFRTEQSIISLVCNGLQPDSKEEQEVREQISLISWFRKIA